MRLIQPGCRILAGGRQGQAKGGCDLTLGFEGQVEDRNIQSSGTPPHLLENEASFMLFSANTVAPGRLSTSGWSMRK